jgi:methylphosphotriester-DNA--protein-cysteine methyltransferase
VKPDDTITRAEFATPHPELRRYITTYYVAEVESPDGDAVQDLLHPEWGSARFLCRGEVQGSIIPAPMVSMPAAIIAGPTSRAAPIACVSMRIVSFGMLPLGWHRFMAQPAHRYADRSVEASELASRVDLTVLLPRLRAATELTEIASIFDDALLASLQTKRRVDSNAENEIESAHRALADPDTSSVSELADKTGITTLQMERLSKKVFGFPPKLLLRRQRFLRTLAIVLREPRSKWGEILDPQYYDQAHFNRDFRRFFGMSPREYLAMPRPIVAAAARERMRTMDGPLQGLQMPVG